MPLEPPQPTTTTPSFGSRSDNITCLKTHEVPPSDIEPSDPDLEEVIVYDESQERFPVPSPEKLIETLHALGLESYGRSLELCKRGIPYKKSKLFCNKWRFCARCRSIRRFTTNSSEELPKGIWSITVLTLPPESFTTGQEGISVLVAALKNFKERLNKWLYKKPNRQKNFALFWVIEMPWSFGRWHPHVHLLFRGSERFARKIHSLWSRSFPSSSYTYALRVERARDVKACVGYNLKTDVLSGRIPENKLKEYILATHGIRMRGVLGALRDSSLDQADEQDEPVVELIDDPMIESPTSEPVATDQEVASAIGLIEAGSGMKPLDLEAPSRDTWVDVLVAKLDGLPPLMSEVESLGFTQRPKDAGPTDEPGVRPIPRSGAMSNHRIHAFSPGIERTPASRSESKLVARPTQV